MSFYKKATAVGEKLIGKDKVFRYGFNWSPMYRRSTARITEVTKDLSHIKIKLPISWKNRNYANSIFGGSMFSAVDPIPMIQLVGILGDDYIVWDKSANVRFRRPAKEHLYASFDFSAEEIAEIKRRVGEEQEIEIERMTQLTNQEGGVVFCEIQKTIYIADKAYYKEKRKQRGK
ncbi:MAG TPA: DUF4442 domain-containing protein [Cytophagales bacterium]|nr:DUF4442 domain-containing protein [Cytophagales bacterium]HAA22019.1 DUF4442 domain-containing protein [Cytophagales bacterium]HAP58790.1 DUF4442 domain-containing protein [Cytophagales bacterium]